MVHVSTMADDYYRFIEKAHVLRGEKSGRVYRLGDKVAVQLIRVDLERRLIDLGLTEILDAVRESERNRGPRRSQAAPGPAGRRHQDRTTRVKSRKRPGPRERAFKKAARTPTRTKKR
jgi:ribonuclease R